MSKKYTTKEFIEKCKSIHEDKYEYINTMYVNSATKVLITCKIHGEFNLRAGDHLFGYGCPKCSEMYLDTKKFIKKAKLIHGERYDYSLTEYISAKNKVRIICKTHGEFVQRTSDHLNGCGCPKCISSQGEILIMKFLNEKNIAFEKEKKFNSCKGLKRILPFDFYLPEYNQLIEFDGQQHFFVVKYWGGLEKFKKQQKIDEIKNNFAEKNKINLLRIKFDEINNINNILNNII